MHTCPAPHALPHPPQLAADVARSASHPFDPMASQSATPVPHTQTAGAMPLHTWPVRHAVPQPPQFAALVSVFTQVSPHRVSPVPQPLLQPEAVHTGEVPLHTVPHAPQFIGSVSETLQSGSPTVHRRRPGMHSHVPAVQTSCAAHACAHAPH